MRPSSPVTGGVQSASTQDTNSLHLGQVGFGVSLDEEEQGQGSMHTGRVTDDGGVGLFVADDDHTIRAKDFDTLVVAVHCPATVVDAADCAIAIPQGDQGGIDVAGFADGGINQHAAGCKHGVNLVIQQESGHVEVVDGLIEEDAARDLDVGDRWGFRITAGDTHDVGNTDLAGCNHISSPLEIGIEATIESDLELDSGLFHCCQRFVYLDQIKMNRLFTEDVFASLGAFLDQAGVCVGAGANNDGIDAWILKDIPVVLLGIGDVEIRSQSFGGREVNVRHGHQIHVGNAMRQMLAVQATDPSGSDESDVEFLGHTCPRYSVAYCVFRLFGNAQRNTQHIQIPSARSSAA